MTHHFQTGFVQVVYPSVHFHLFSHSPKVLSLPDEQERADKRPSVAWVSWSAANRHVHVG